MYSPLACRHLHSFPTRRSSDLFRYAFLTHTAHHVSLNAKRGRVLSARPLAVTSSGGSADEPRAHPSWLTCSGRTARGASDRKSTRLNSSHVRISYAVFCLKKKCGVARLVTVIVDDAGQLLSTLRRHQHDPHEMARTHVTPARHQGFHYRPHLGGRTHRAV